MLYVTFSLNALLMVALPIALGFFLARRFGQPWRLFAIGALTFVASQVLHIPFNAGLTALFTRGVLPAPPAAWRLVFNAVVLGLSAGVFEEVARYLVYRYWIRGARRWEQALMFGAGHGGFEAIAVGLLAGVSAINLFVLRSVDLAALPVPPEQLAEVQRQVAAAWSLPWWMTLLGALERALTLPVHLALAVLVLQAFIRRGGLAWLAAAIGWHALLNAAELITLGVAGPVWAEAVVGVVTLASLAMILALRRSPAPEVPAVPGGPPSEGLASRALAAGFDAALDPLRPA